MADQVQTIAGPAQQNVHGLQQQVDNYTSGVFSSLGAWGSQITAWGQGILDRFFPPEQRAAILAKIQEFMLTNPKLSVRTYHTCHGIHIY